MRVESSLSKTEGSGGREGVGGGKGRGRGGWKERERRSQRDVKTKEAQSDESTHQLRSMMRPLPELGSSDLGGGGVLL